MVNEPERGNTETTSHVDPSEQVVTRQIYDHVIAQVGSHWPSVSGLKNMVIFGASYCDIQYSFQTSPRPTLEEPLGVPFPGYTYNEPEKANWVGHLISRLKAAGTRVLVYDFAVGGNTVDGAAVQIRNRFLRYMAAQTPPAETERLWGPDNALFSIWIGINDCAFVKLEGIHPRIVKLFGLIGELYETGARNFMLVDVPPINRSPAMRSKPKGKLNLEEWNDQLRVYTEEFAKSHPDVTMLIYSSWKTFTRVLDDPVAYGFKDGQQKQKGGTIWYDHIHPTSKMHDEVAKDVETFLNSVAPLTL